MFSIHSYITHYLFQTFDAALDSHCLSHATVILRVQVHSAARSMSKYDHVQSQPF